MPIWDKIAAYLEAQGRIALVTVIEAQGSTPREPGARMLVLPDGRISGTIGGGALEWQALGAAQSALAKGQESFAIRSFALGPELGQCCGGRVKLAVEVMGSKALALARDLASREARGSMVTILRQAPDNRVERRPLTQNEVAALAPEPVITTPDGALIERFEDDAAQLYLFGAGHVGRALALALAPLPFRITWIDPRPDAFPERVPANVRAIGGDDPVALLDGAPEGAFVLAMTHSHPLDLDVVAHAFRLGRFPYVGLIGSATKRARFLKRLDEMGLGQAARAELVCPIGLGAIRSKLPAAIAAGIAAQLLARRDELAGAHETAERARTADG